MEEPFESNFDGETLALVKRFEKTLQQDQNAFFDVDEYEEIIEYYFFKNEQKKAHLSIRQGLAQHPESTGLLLKLAQYCVNANKDHEAFRILKETDLTEGSDHELFIAKGNLYSQLEKPEKAIEEYKMALRGADFIDEIYSSIAFEYENLGKYDNAIDFLLKALEINPENEAALYELSFCCEVSRQSERNVAFLTEFIDKNPYSQSAWFNLGIAYSNLELFEKAIEAYDYVLAIDETFSSAYFNKANCYANIGQYDKAIEVYFETFYYEDPEPVTYYYIAECYEKIRDFESAIIYYQKAVTLDPDFGDAWLGIGISYDELGNSLAALPHIERAIKLSPTVPEYWFILGDIQIKLSRTDDGIAAYRKVIELDPDDPDIWLDLSVVYSNMKDYQEAYQILLSGLHYHETNADFYYGMAYYLFLIGRSNQANETLSKALEMDYEGHQRLFTTFPEAKNHTAVLEIISGFKKEH